MTEGIGSAPVASVSAAPSGGVGVSHGFESGNGQGFSSKGLSDFKPGVEHTSSKPMVDINHGKEYRSMFHDVKSFNSGPKMFDISRPVVDHPVIPHENRDSQPARAVDSIVNIRHGKENHSMFKDIGSLNNSKNVIDTSKPTFDEKIEPHPETQPTHEVSKPSMEFRKMEPRVSAEGNSRPSAFENTVTLWSAKENGNAHDESNVSMQSNKVSRTEKPSDPGHHARNASNALQAGARMTVLENGNQEPRVSAIDKPFDSGQARMTAREMKPSDSGVAELPRMTVLFEPEVRTDVSTYPQVETVSTSFSKPSVRTEIQTSMQDKAIPELVGVRPLSSPETKIEVGVDVAYAQALVPEIMAKTHMSRAEAQQVVVKALAQKYEASPEVSVAPLTETRTQTEAKTQPKAEIQTQRKTSFESKVKALHATRQQEKADAKAELEEKAVEEVKAQLEKKGGKKEHAMAKIKKTIFETLKREKKVLYFEKDEKVNRERMRQIVSRAQFMFYKRQFEKGDVTGRDIAGLMPDTHNKNMISELVKMRSFDGSYEDFKKDVAKMGEVQSVGELKDKAEKIAEENTAVRLTFQQPKEEATGREASKVYKQTLNGVQAYVADEGSVGHLFAQHETREVEYINYNKTREYPVMTKMVEDAEIELNS